MGKQILLVDDNRVLMAYLSNLLEREGHAVVVAYDGLAALEMLKDFRPDIIFVDLIMPRIDGDKLCQIARNMPRMKDCYMVVISAALPEMEAEGVPLGADACIAKGNLKAMGDRALAAVAASDAPRNDSQPLEIDGIETVYARRMTRELLDRTRHLEAVLDSISQGILEITAGRVVTANAAAVDLLNTPLDSILAQPPLALFPATAQPLVADLLERADGEAPDGGKDRVVDLGGRKVSLHAISVQGEPAYRMVILTDVSQRHLLAKKQGAKLWHLQAVDRIDALVGEMTDDHDGLRRRMLAVIAELFACRRCWLIRLDTDAAAKWHLAAAFPDAADPTPDAGTSFDLSDSEARFWQRLSSASLPEILDGCGDTPFQQLDRPAAPGPLLCWAIKTKQERPWLLGLQAAAAGQEWSPARLHLFKDICQRFAGVLGHMVLYQRLEASEERWRSVLDNIEDAYFEVDLDGNLLFFNDSASRLLGYAPEDLIGLNHHQYLDPVTAAKVSETFNRVYRTGRPTKAFDWEVRRKDGSGCILESSISLMRDPDGTPAGFRGIARDVTERKAAEQALRQSELQLKSLNEELERRVAERTQQLEEANRSLEDAARQARQLARETQSANVAKSEFLANMSHEIRTPMNGILGMCNLALNMELSRQQREYLNIIRSSAMSLLGLINDILDFSKIEAGKLDFEKAPFAFRDVIEEVSDVFLEKMWKKEIEMVVDIAPEIPVMLEGDPLRLRQVLLNLTSNALKFTDRGEISIGVDPVDTADNAVTLQFVVRDTGIGISPRNLQHLFDAFTQGDGSSTRKYEGTGLGLAICKQIVSLMEGEIWVESKPGEGSAFFFTARFPVVPDQGPGVDTLPEPLKDLTVMLVEDNRSTTMVIRRAITSLGLRVESYPDAESALERFEAAADGSGAPIDLILMDVGLPGMDGIAAAELIREERRSDPPPVVVISASGRQEEIRRAKMAGVASYLIKPIKQGLLVNTIRQLFGYGHRLENREEDGALATDDFSGLAVLLVEDNYINQRVAYEILKAEGIRVETAANGIEALKLLKVHQFDAILMDIQMPEMDGIEATRRIRAVPGLHALPIVAMTAHTMFGDRERCLQAGMNDYVSKPIDRKELFTALRRCIRPETPVPERPVPATEDGLPILDGLDVSEGVQRIGGSLQLYAEIINEYRAYFRDFLSGFSSAVNAGDWGEAQQMAHSMKGAAGNISAGRLRDAAAELERRCASQSTTELDPLLKELEAALAQVLSSAKQLMTVAEG
jgi:two-component system sensor histidine kinase/response regulator